MIALDSLKHYADQALWISDDRISALASARSQGLEQIDFHGVQPVSRNAKLLQHPEGVLRFWLDFAWNGTAQSLALTWEKLSVYPAGIVQTRRLDSLEIIFEVVVCGSALLAQCRCTAANPMKNSGHFQFKIDWNVRAMTTAVHGHRIWAEPKTAASGQLLLQATDRIELRDWLRRTGDYQGDFLIPEGWRRLIFQRRCVSGSARWQDVRPEYRDMDIHLYDADTWILLGAAGLVMNQDQDDIYRFRSDPAALTDGVWSSPVFAVQFYAEKPLTPKNSTTIKSIVFLSQQDRYRQLAASVPRLELPDYPALEEFFVRVPQIVESARVQDYGLTRACPGTYYWLWAWDNMVTALAQCHWGDLANIERVVDFLRSHRDLDGSIPGRWTRHLEPMDGRGFGGPDFLFSELVLMLYSETQNRQILRANYTVLVHAFTELAQRCHDNGLFPGIGMYPDLPAKMGRDETFYVAIDAGPWYGLCRNLEKIAWMLNDRPTAGRAAALADQVEQHFLPIFWDEQQGFLCDAYHPATDAKTRSFPLFSLLFLESPFGYELLKEKIGACSRFITAHLLGATGLSLTPTWDINHTSEPALSAWYPHWDFPAMKAWTQSGADDSIRHWLELVHTCYSTLGYCPEFLALNVPAAERWQHHGAAWNLNCASGWYNAILHGLIGVEFDLGGITCRPAAAILDRAGTRIHPVLKNLSYRGGLWDVEFTGDGKFITGIAVDDTEILVTLKIPRSFYTPNRHELKIRYGSMPVDHPLLLELWGAEVEAVGRANGQLVYHIQGFGRVDLRFYAPNQQRLQLDSVQVDYQWQPHSSIGSCRLYLSGQHELKLIGRF